MIKKGTSKPNGVIVFSFKEEYAKDVVQKQKEDKTIDTITKFPENRKKKPKATSKKYDRDNKNEYGSLKELMGYHLNLKKEL